MVYTIGYAGITLEKFLQVLQELKVLVLIDARSLPKSKYFFQYNDANLNKSLNAIGVIYENWLVNLDCKIKKVHKLEIQKVKNLHKPEKPNQNFNLTKYFIYDNLI